MIDSRTAFSKVTLKFARIDTGAFFSCCFSYFYSSGIALTVHPGCPISIAGLIINPPAAALSLLFSPPHTASQLCLNDSDHLTRQLTPRPGELELYTISPSRSLKPPPGLSPHRKPSLPRSATSCEANNRSRLRPRPTARTPATRTRRKKKKKEQLTRGATSHCIRSQRSPHTLIVDER